MQMLITKHRHPSRVVASSTRQTSLRRPFHAATCPHRIRAANIALQQLLGDISVTPSKRDSIGLLQ
jgi:hypothetical protein